MIDELELERTYDRRELAAMSWEIIERICNARRIRAWRLEDGNKKVTLKKSALIDTIIALQENPIPDA